MRKKPARTRRNLCQHKTCSNLENGGFAASTNSGFMVSRCERNGKEGWLEGQTAGATVPIATVAAPSSLMSPTFPTSEELRCPFVLDIVAQSRLSMIQKLTAVLLAVLLVNPFCCCASDISDEGPKRCCAQKDASERELPMHSPEPCDPPCGCSVKGVKSSLETKITIPGRAWTLADPCPCGEFVYALPSWDQVSNAQAAKWRTPIGPPHYQVHCVYRL